MSLVGQETVVSSGISMITNIQASCIIACRQTMIEYVEGLIISHPALDDRLPNLHCHISSALLIIKVFGGLAMECLILVGFGPGHRVV